MSLFVHSPLPSAEWKCAAMLVVSGRVAAPQGGSFAGHRVLLTYRRMVTLSGQPPEPPAEGEPPAEPAQAEVPDAASAPLATDGAFHLNLPDLAEVRDPVEIAVLAPSGVTLEHQPLKLKQLETPLELSATPAQPYVVRPSEDPALGQPQRLTGRVIGQDGRPAGQGLPLVIYGLNGAAGDAARPLLSLKTQVGGYFSGPWPADALVAAYGEIGGERAPISLVDGRLPQRAVLVVDLPAVEDECGCTPTPPRAPDQLDLVANPEAYSQDLGGGCVNLTMPNRVIEEYPYVTVVRTTEPDVRPMNTEPPRRIPPDVLRRIASLVVDERGHTRSLRAIAAERGAGHIDGEVLDHDNGHDRADHNGDNPGHERTEADGLDRTAAAQQLVFSLDTRRARELIADPATITREGVLAAAVKSEAIDLRRMIDLLGGRPTRTALDGRHSIDWDATPTVYEATTVALGHVLHFRQVWRADGYSLGDLLYSLPLAPGQKRMVSMLDWTRRTTAERTEVLESEEAMQSLVERDRDISEIVGSHLDERIDGGSSTSTSAAGGGIGAGFFGGGFGVLAGVAGGASSSESSSWQDSSRTLAGNSLQQLRDRTTQRAASVRSVRSTTVQTVTQGETVRAETEVVANHNHCHAITVEYFEVLRHFQVSEELAYVSECVFVPLPMLPFDRAKARRWRAVLAEFLRRPELAKGFDAIDRIATNWDGWDYPERRFSEEAPEELDGELRVSFVIPRPHDDEDGAYNIDAWNWLSPFLWMAPSAVFNLMSDHVNNLFRDINRELTAEFYTQIQRARDEYFAKEIAPRIAENIVHRMRFGYVTRAGVRVPLPMDASLISKYAEGVPLYVSARASGGLPALPREEIHRFRVSLDEDLYAGMPFNFDVVPAEARILVTSGKARYRTPHLEHLLFDNPRVNNDLGNGDDVMIATPTSFAERRDPRAEDRRAADGLVKHLNEHLEFYHQAIWHSLDPQRRYLLLDGIIAPNSGGRSIASVVENRLIGIVGNCMVLPVTPGIHLDPSLAPDPETGERVELIHAYAADPAPPTRISVPTRGVYAESVMGECNACEKKDDTRFWRWEESPLPDEPTPIEPISTDSRRADEPDATPTPLPQPIVNIQNAPALPDPLGLSQALEILGRSDVFRDASGLAGTQRNALAAFHGVMDTAKAFGGMAAKMAQQQEMGRNVDRTLEQIKGAQSTGMLSQQQAQELAHAALQSLAGDVAPEHQNPVHDPQVSKAIEKATESASGSVTVSSPGETVTAVFDDGQSGGTSLGAVTAAPAFELVSWVSVPMTFDSTSDEPSPPRTYTRSSVSSKLADLKSRSRRAWQVSPGVFRFSHYWDALTGAGGPLRKNPAAPDQFQVELRLRVVMPAGGKPGKLPLVILSHGNHKAWVPKTETKIAGAPPVTVSLGGGATAPADQYHVDTLEQIKSHEGYAYLQEELAANDIISVSVDHNFCNFFGAFIETRSDFILKAIEEITRQATTAGTKLFGRVDLDKVGLMGHSRGGDAVVRAANRIAGMSPKPCTVKAVCSLSPTDFTGSTPPADRYFLDSSHTGFYLVVYGALDNDVSGVDGPGGYGGTGFRHYDRATCEKAMVFLRRNRHDSFNSVWHADSAETVDPQVVDLDTTKAPLFHQLAAKSYICGMFRWRLAGANLAASFSTGSTADASLQHLFGTQLKRIDGFESGTNALGGTRAISVPAPDIASVRDENQVTRVGGTPLGVHMPHQSHLLQLEWNTAPASRPADGVAAYQSDIPDAHKDWSGMDLLVLNLGGWYDPKDQPSIDAEPLPRVRITLIDKAGGSAVVDFSTYGAAVPTRPISVKKDDGSGTKVNATLMRLESVPIELSKFTGVDLKAVTKVVLAMEKTGNVTTFVDNIHVMKR